MTELRSGIALAGYRIEALLGSGSMGSVYSALDVELDRRVAVKVLRPELALDDRFRRRFLDETRLAAGLEHPHVIPVHAAGEADGHLYLVMRYVDGRDLAAVLRSLGRLDPERVLHVLGQVAGALDAAHARGLVHRDVKPANILLARGGPAGAEHAYLCDFGLAKLTSTVSSLSGERGIVGTVDYLAPEQIEGLPVDGRADVYALGCVAFECLTGRAPFARDNELAALMAHVNEAPPRTSDLVPELPEALDDVLARALDRDRERRHATASELVADARTALAGGTPAAAPPKRAPSSALRTFLFADIRGYTSYTREHGDEAGAALAQGFAAIAAEAGPAHGGHLQELRGDEALLVFDSARDALRFAVELQRRVAAAALPRGVGVGVDAGEAVPVEGGYRGGALNRAARLCGLARAGEVLATEGVTELAGRGDGFAYGLHRFERLKGFDRPVRVVEVHPDGRRPSGVGRRLRGAVRGPRPRVRLAAALVAVAAVAALVVVLTRDEPLPTAGPGQIAVLDARTLEPVATVDRLGAPDVLWRGPDGGLWALDYPARLASRLDPDSLQVTARVPLSGIEPGPPAVGAGALWVGDDAAPAVARYDPGYGTLVRRIRLPAKGLTDPDQTTGLAVGAGSIWAAYGKWPYRIARIDPATNRVASTIDLPDPDGVAMLAFGGGALWVVVRDTGRIWKIDPASEAVIARGRLHGGSVEDARFAAGSLWVAVQDDGAVWQVDPDASVRRSVPTGAKPYALGDDGSGIVVANQNGGTVSRIDTSTGRVTTRRVGHMPNTATVAGGRVWVALTQSAADARRGLDPARTVQMVTQGDPWGTTDPPLAFAGPGAQLQRAVGARLLGVPAGPQGRTGELVPELADLPSVSADGRTYTFRIRSGFRFSPPSNAPVTAEVMRSSIERALSPGFKDFVDPSIMLADLEGFDAYRRGDAAHVAGIQVRGNRLEFRLRRPAPDFPARVSLPAFSAVPPGTPVLAHGLPQPIPSAGPFYLASHIGGTQAVLRRNPNHPDAGKGDVDAIVVANAVDTDQAVGDVVAGRADVAPAPPAAQSGGLDGAWLPDGTLDRRFGAGAARQGGPRFVRTPFPAIRFLFFNTRKGLFRDPVLRRAVLLALDRRSLTAPLGERPWQSPIGPGMPGAPDLDAPVPGPDLERARALARGRGGEALLFVNTPDRCAECVAVGQRIRNQLAAIGIRVRVRPDARTATAFADPDTPADLISAGWVYDWPDPSNVVNNLVDAARPLGYGFNFPDRLYTDERGLAAIRAAYQVGGPARDGAYRRAVATLERHAPVAVIGVSEQPTLLGARVGCASFPPQDLGYLDLAALCLR